VMHGSRPPEAWRGRVEAGTGFPRSATAFSPYIATGVGFLGVSNRGRIMRTVLPCLVAGFLFGSSLVAAGPPVGRDRVEDKAVADFYRPDEVQAVHLTVADADLKRMLAALPELVDVPATFRWRDTTVEGVSVRFKGNSSSQPNQPYKRSFLVKFDKYDGDRRFYGLRQVSFDNGVQFGSLFSEPVVTEILRDHGVPAHRSNYAKVYVNKEYRGVYVNVERIDESFLANHLPDPAGALFKVDEGGPGCNFQFLGDEPALYRKAFDPKTKAAKRHPEKLVDFVKLVNATKPADFARTLDANMVTDDFLRVTAVMLLAGAFDQLTGWNPHNYYLYLDTKANRWRYLPWDLDVGFCETAFGKIRVLEDWNAAWPVPTTGAPNVLMDRVVGDPALLARYRREARKILDASFEPGRLCKTLDAKYALIKGDLSADPFPPRRITVPGDRDYDGIVESMKVFVRKRHASAVRQLDTPGERPQTRRPPPGPEARFGAKVQRIQKRVMEMQRAGQDITPVIKVMNRFGPALQAGKPDEAEKLLAEALKLVGEKDE
jgi:hypothetical protein